MQLDILFIHCFQYVDRAEYFYLYINALIKYTHNCTIQGELHWQTQERKQCLCCIRLWCHFINMVHNRLTKYVFLRAYNKSVIGEKQHMSLDDVFVFLLSDSKVAQ